MSQETKGTLIIRYVNGTEQQYEYSRQPQDASVATRLEEALKANVVVLDTGDALLAIPATSILCLEISPRPEKLPRNVVRGARLIS